MSNCCADAPKKKQPLTHPVQCACQKSTPPQSPVGTTEVNKVRYFGIGIAALALWWAVYSVIVPLSQWLTYDLFSLGPIVKPEKTDDKKEGENEQGKDDQNTTMP